MKPALTVILGVAMAAGGLARAADDFQLTWSTLDGGGGVLTGDGYEVSGTIGEPDVGMLTDGDVVLEGGFWVSPPTSGRTPCRADINRDNFLDFFDYDAFIDAYESGGPEADFNMDGFQDFFDYDDFVAAYEAGC